MAGNKTRHVFRFQHSQRILIKTGKRTEILLRLAHLIPYSASLHRHNSGRTNTLLKEGRKEQQLVGSVEQGKSEGGDCSCTGLLELLHKKNKMMPCTACSVAGDQPLLTPFLAMPFHWPKAAASSRCPWLGLHGAKAGSPSQRILQGIFWSKSSRRPETAFWAGLWNPL